MAASRSGCRMATWRSIRPASCMRLTRRRQVGGETCTCSARDWLLCAASVCSRLSSCKSVLSSDMDSMIFLDAAYDPPIESNPRANTMCGIVGAVSTRNIVPILVQGLQRLEYRGYDSCGVAVHASSLDAARPAGLQRARSTARVAELLEQVTTEHIDGATGIANTRWATHGAPAVHSAHPHFSHGTGADAKAQSAGRGALVHNGIIENHEELRFGPARLRQCRG